MLLLKNISFNYKLLNYGAKSLRQILTTRTFKDLVVNKKVLQGLNLHVESGSILGLVGKNGSGKTTLLRVIAEILPISNGSVTKDGDVSPIIGVNSFTDPELTPEENIRFYADIKGMNKNRSLAFKLAVLEFCNYSVDELKKPIKTFSSGMNARLNFALGIKEFNSIYLLDEILSVGDIEFTKKAIGEIIELKKKNKIVILVAHNLSIINAVADQVAILNNGQIIDFGNTETMLNKYKGLKENMFAETVIDWLN